jgi:hypothetical protein
MTTTEETYTERRDREKREAREMTAKVSAEIALEMTTATGETWRAILDPDDWKPRLVLLRERDGISLFMSHSWQKENIWYASSEAVKAPDGTSIRLSDWRPRDCKDYCANISDKKTPAQIARDIIRRIVPAAENAAQRALEGWKKQTERTAWLEATTARFLSDCPGLELSRQSENNPSRREFRRYGRPHITAEIEAYDHDAKLTLCDISPETALAVLKLVDSLTTTEEAES